MADRFDASDEEEEDFNPGLQEDAVSNEGENGDAEPNGDDAAETVARKQQQLDDELAGEEEDEEDEGEDRVKLRDGDDEEDDEEDEDDEDAVTDRPRKRRRRDRMNQFIEMEAEVDEDDEDEDEDDEDVKDFVENEPEAVEDLGPGVDNDDRMHREMDRRRQEANNADAEEIAKRFQQQYGRRERVAQDTSIVPREFLAPSVDDPRIYGVKCKPGKERDVVYSILKRVEERQNSRAPLKIFSAVERGGPMAGFVYVEARQQKDIMEAVDGIMFCYPHGGFTLLPIKEMPDILRVRPTESLQTGQYVRIKRAGLYQGDLAQVDDVTTNGLEVTLKLVPRLHYGLDEGTGTDAKRKRPGAVGAGPRPAPRMFSESEAKKKFSQHFESMTGIPRGFRFFGDDYIDGFLIKDWKLQHLQVKDVHPSLEEVARFSVGQKDGTENLDLTALAASIKNNTSGDDYQAGDVVEVYEGEQQGLWGKAIGVRRDIVSIMVSEGPLKGQRIEAPAKSLRKRFREGDHVKVIGQSRFRDEVGMVVGIKADKVTFVSDMSMQEITVFSKDLRVATDSGASGSIGQYNLHDLVQLDQATVGCIVKIERETMRVLDQFDATRNVMPSQIANKIEKRRNAVATDRAGNEIRLEDTVKEVEGERRTGTILHIYRSFVFLMNRELRENSGIFVTRATNVATVAAKGGRQQGSSAGPDLSRMNPALQRAPGQNGGMMPPPRQFGGRDPAIGKSVVIVRGPYKGLMGIVKDSSDAVAKVELHSKNKTLPIEKNSLKIRDQNGNSIAYADFVARGRGRGGPPGGGGGFNGGRTPAAGGGGGGWGGGRTPMGDSGMNGGRTPGWGASSTARQPAWASSGGAASGGRTPGWAAGAGSHTPAWQQDGGRTAYGGGGSGGRTPAGNGWGGNTSYGGATAYGGGGQTSYGGSTSYGGTTYDAGNKTPAPAAYDAPTPGAPTPGAPTPGAFADSSTPYASGASKSGWGGDDDDDDDGPRYTD